MTDQERIKSILAELEHDYIGYDNLYNDEAHGCAVIKRALEHELERMEGGEKHDL